MKKATWWRPLGGYILFRHVSLGELFRASRIPDALNANLSNY